MQSTTSKKDFIYTLLLFLFLMFMFMLRCYSDLDILFEDFILFFDYLFSKAELFPHFISTLGADESYYYISFWNINICMF